MSKSRVGSVVLLFFTALIGIFVYYSQLPANQGSWFYRPFKLGLDLSGGSHLVFQADTSKLASGSDVRDAMSSLRDVIERRVNIFGVSEPLIQTEEAGIGAEVKHRLIVDLPGVTDLEEAVKTINRTPVLDFRLPKEGLSEEAQMAAQTAEEVFNPTPLNGQYLKKASVDFNQQSITPAVALEFTSEGAKIFADLTRANVGKPIAIFLDGQMISAPVVREEIRDGKAVITGNFTLDEAKQLVRDLNLGALPVPVSLISSQTIGPTLGEEAIDRGINAGIIGFILVTVFLIVLYRLPGFLAALSLSVYIIIMLALFKLVPVTLTAAGIAALILSVGMAVDANVLIFERLRDELKRGKTVRQAVEDGFARAWTAIRDANLSALLISAVLFWFGSSLIKGFALTLALGVVVGLLTTIIFTRTFLRSFGFEDRVGIVKFLFGGRLSS